MALGFAAMTLRGNPHPSLQRRSLLETAPDGNQSGAVSSSISFRLVERIDR